MITRITQKNLAKHPIHPTMPSPNSSPRNPNSCIPQPIMPRSTNAPIPINMINSIVILSLSQFSLGYCRFILGTKKGANQFHSVLKVLDYLYNELSRFSVRTKHGCFLNMSAVCL